MNEMVYSRERRMKILAEGIYKGRKYCILSLGAYPTAYVEYRYEFDEESEEYFNIPCHGGITFQDYARWKKDDNTRYIGWDYGHVGDFIGSIGQQDRKKWTTEEIYEEVKNVIDYLNEYERKSVVRRLDDFVYEVLNCDDDDVDFKELLSYKTLIRDLKILDLLKKEMKRKAIDVAFGKLSENNLGIVKEWFEVEEDE